MTAVEALLVLVLGVAVLVALGRLRQARHLHDGAAAQLRTVQQGITEAIQVFARDGTLISRNPAADRIFETEGELTREAVTSRWTFIREDGTTLEREERPLGMAMRTGVTAERVTVGIRDRRDGAVKWLSMSTFPIRGRRQRVLGYVSCAWDVTERTHTIRELEVLNRAAARLTSSLVPEQVRLTLVDAAAELCSVPGETSRRVVLSTIHGDAMETTVTQDPESPSPDAAPVLSLADHPYVREVITTQRAVVAELNGDNSWPAGADDLRQQELRSCVWVPLSHAGAVTAVLSVGGRGHSPISTAQCQRLTTLVAMAELALDNANVHAQVAELARTDPLTGVSNRRALDEKLGHLGRGGYALVAIDIDNLKRVNDTHGHQAGDQLIASVAASMAGLLRPADMLARMGGDEFLVLLVDCDARGAADLGGRLQAAVALVRLPWGAASISVGSAASAPNAGPQDVAEAADVALYAAKQARPVAAAAPAKGEAGGHHRAAP